MREELKRRIAEAFACEIEPEGKPFLYRLGLGLVTVVMVLLPVVYVAIIAALGWGLSYHVTHHQYLLDMRGPRRYELAMYLVPIVVGGMLVLFMITPLIPRLSRRPKPLYTITPQNEPLFYAFIEQICCCVHAPMPREIQLIMQPNAFAAFRRGALSFFLPGDLTLAIGLPLIGAMSVQKLAGVVAHEMGHFTQGTGMRLSYVINSIHGWFYRAVHEPNIVEDKLEGMVEAEGYKPAAVSIIILLSMLFIWLTKLVLLGLMTIGYLVSNFLSRQMEYDADRHQVEVAGSRSFETTMYSIVLLDRAFHDATIMSMAGFQKGVLCADLPGLVKTRAKAVAAQKKEDCINEMLVDDTRLFDTHPSPRDRIARAKRLDEPGLCDIREPAAALLRDFKTLAGNLTRSFYLTSIEGSLAAEARLLETQEFLEFFDTHCTMQRGRLIDAT